MDSFFGLDNDQNTYLEVLSSSSLSAAQISLECPETAKLDFDVRRDLKRNPASFPRPLVVDESPLSDMIRTAKRMMTNAGKNTEQTSQNAKVF